MRKHRILAARNTPASGPDNPRDVDGDGIITVLVPGEPCSFAPDRAVPPLKALGKIASPTAPVCSPRQVQR